jgi:hypothetical protein
MIMRDLNRRSFIGTSVGALALLNDPLAALACSESAAAALPSRLNVAHAARQNLRAYFKNESALGLAGLVSMETVKGEFGTYAANSLFLFPYTKPNGPSALPAAYLPVGEEGIATTMPFTPAGLALDEQFCRYVLQAPPESFIGFVIEKPVAEYLAHYPWFTNVHDLVEGKSVGIHWTSGNLNPRWFNGSTWIPPGTTDGAHWRRLIVDGLREAASPVA